MESCFQATLRRKMICGNGPETARFSGHLGPTYLLFASGVPVKDARPPIEWFKVRQ